MRNLSLVFGLIAAWTSVQIRGARSTPNEEIPYCTGNPLQDENAVIACSWILDVTSPFFECMASFETVRIKEFFSMCVNFYCDMGKQGACRFADNMAGICKGKFGNAVGLPDFCGPVTTVSPPSYCVDAPEQDEKAIEACSWIEDSDSPYQECIGQLSLDKIKQLLLACVTIYCEKGEPGVCENAENVAGLCAEDFNTNVIERPDFCVSTTAPPLGSSTTTPPGGSTTTAPPGGSTTPTAFCTEEPTKDEHAVEACDWIISADSPFWECVQLYDLVKVKDFLAICLSVYCEHGQRSVCEFADNFAGICEMKFGLTVPGEPARCVNP